MTQWGLLNMDLRHQRSAFVTLGYARQVFMALVLCILAATSVFAIDLTARFYSQKPAYILGEPVWFVFKVTNKGNSPVYIRNANPYGVCALWDYSFDVPGTRATGRWRCRPYGGSCAGGGLTRLAPGATYEQKLLLNQWFRIDHVGTYRVIARRNLRFSRKANPYTLLVPGHRTFRTNFEIKIVKGDEGVVRKAFEPFMKNLDSHDFKLRIEAIETITAVAPPFLEKAIITLAEGKDGFARSRAIPALSWLNTANTRRVLAKLARDRQRGYSGHAINALARTHDRTYVPLLERMAKDPAWQNVVIPALGDLGGRSVIWFLAPLIYFPLGPPNMPPLQQLAIRGLANTGSREAIPYLIQALRTPLVQQDAVNGLEQLTHYVIFQKDGRHWFYPEDDRAADRVAERWQRWWVFQGSKARVYGPDDCGNPPEELPER